MPEPIRVDPQVLAQIAGRLREDADTLLAGHRSATTAADDAQRGLVGRSARSIAAKAAGWQTATAELHRVLTSQADALASAAAAYARTEQNNRDKVESLDPTDL